MHSRPKNNQPATILKARNHINMNKRITLVKNALETPKQPTSHYTQKLEII